MMTTERERLKHQRKHAEVAPGENIKERRARAD